MKYFGPRILMGLSLAYIFFDLVILSLLERYHPDSEITKKLASIVRTHDKVKETRES